jgi:hypothetical protein
MQARMSVFVHGIGRNALVSCLAAAASLGCGSEHETRGAGQPEAPDREGPDAAPTPSPTNGKAITPKPAASDERPNAHEPVAPADARPSGPKNVREVPSAAAWPAEADQPRLTLPEALAAVAVAGATIDVGPCRRESRALTVGGVRVGATEGCEPSSTVLLQGPDLAKAIDTSPQAIFGLPGLTCVISETRVFTLSPIALRDDQPGQRLWCQTFAPIRDYWFSAPDAPADHDGVVVDGVTALRLADGGELVALLVRPETTWGSPLQMNLRTEDPEFVAGQILARDPSAPQSIVHAGQILNASDLQAALAGYTVKRVVPNDYALFREDRRVATISGLYYGHVSSVILSGPGLATVDGVQIDDPYASIAAVSGLECYGSSPDSLRCVAEADGATYYYDFRSDPPPPAPDPYARSFGEGEGPHDHRPARPLKAASAERIGRKAKLAQVHIIAPYPIRPRSD